MGACDEHLRRSWLLGELAGPLDRVRARIGELLALSDEDLIAAVAGVRRTEIADSHRSFTAAAAAELRSCACDDRVELVCGCASAYPAALRDLEAAPAVLHVTGESARLAALTGDATVAIVGTRTATDAGKAVAGSLGRDLCVSGLCVISGMAGGIDSAAHDGALNVNDERETRASATGEVGSCATIAVLPAAPQRSYPPGARRLHARIVSQGLAISEIGRVAAVRPWMLVARNRIIAALARMTVVVEAPTRSGALITANYARSMSRLVGAVPGPVGGRANGGTNQMLREGARVIRGAGDVLEDLSLPLDALKLRETRTAPTGDEARLLEIVSGGGNSVSALISAGLGIEATLAGVAALELEGWLRRGAGGRLTVVP